MKEITESLFINSTTTIIIAFAGISYFTNSISKKINKLKKMDEIGYSYEFWNVNSKDKPWRVIFGGTTSNEKSTNNKHNPDNHQARPHMSSVYSYSTIANNIRLVTGNDNVYVSFTNIRDINISEWEEFNEQNIIFIGGTLSIPFIIDKLFEKSNQNVAQDTENGERKIIFKRTDDTLESNDTVFESKIDNNILIKDHAVIIRSQLKSGSIFLFCGNYGDGTLCAAKAFSNKLPEQAYKDIISEFKSTGNSLKWITTSKNEYGVNANLSSTQIDTKHFKSEKCNLESFYSETSKDIKTIIHDFKNKQNCNCEKDTTRLVIFDLDDTLVDTFNQLIITLEHVAEKEINKQFPETIGTITAKTLIEYRKFGSRKQASQLFKKFKQNCDEISKIYEEVLTSFDITPLSCTPAMLEMLVKTNKKFFTALVTEGNIKKQNDKIKHLHLNGFFDEIHVIDTGKKYKTIKTIIENHKAIPENCIVVGNRLDNEIKCGNKLNTHTVWVCHGEGSNAENRTGDPNNTIEILGLKALEEFNFDSIFSPPSKTSAN